MYSIAAVRRRVGAHVWAEVEKTLKNAHFWPPVAVFFDVCSYWSAARTRARVRLLFGLSVPSPWHFALDRVLDVPRNYIIVKVERSAPRSGARAIFLLENDEKCHFFNVL